MSETEDPKMDPSVTNTDTNADEETDVDADSLLPEGLGMSGSDDDIQLNQVEPADPQAETIAELERSLEDWRTRAYRSAADLENARKRFQRERDELKKFGTEGLLKDLLSVVDNLERAVAHAGAGSSLTEGVEMVLRQFTQTAAKYGAEPFDAEGQPFDPQFHEAMTQVPTNDHEPGTVVDVYQRGWTLHGRLVRPAMVTVAAAAEPTVGASENPAETQENSAESQVESNEVDAGADGGENA